MAYNEILNDYIKEIQQYKQLTEEETLELFNKKNTAEWEEAKETLLLSNLRLVIYVAKMFIMPNSSLDAMDIIMEGNMGLMIGIDLYNPNLGAKFSTYAVSAIRSKIIRAIEDKDSLIRIPTYLHNEVYKYKQACKEFEEKYGRQPTDEEVINILQISSERLNNYKIVENINIVSTDKKINEDEEGFQSFTYFLADKRTQEAYEEIENYEFWELIDMALDEYCNGKNGKKYNRDVDKIKNILFSRLGIKDGVTESLQSLGDEYGVTRERIRQILNNFLKFCREDFIYKDKLKDFL